MRAPVPRQALFDLLKGAAATTARQSAWVAGRLVVAIDGTQIAVPDSPANLVSFVKPAPEPNGEAGYPMLRLVAIVAVGTRSVIDAVFGTDKVGELTYAARLAAGGGLQAGMLLLADRNFATDNFLAQAAGARATDGTTKAGTYRLLTTPLDPHEAPAIMLVRLYHQRWEIETSYLELKSTMLGRRVLRARHPAGVVQETWALLTAYQILRTAMADAVLAQPHLDPDRASFSIALLTARDQIVRAAGIITDTVIDLTGRIGTAVLDGPLPARTPRIRARVIKRAISKYRAKKRDADRRSRPVTIQTTVLTQPPDS